MAMSATQNPQPVPKRFRLTSRGSAVDSPPATVVDALEFDLTREDSSVEGERDDMGMSVLPTARSVTVSTVEDPPNTTQPSFRQELQHELIPEVRNFEGHGVENDSTESAQYVQEVSTWSHRSTQWQNVQLRAQPMMQIMRSGILWSPELFVRHSPVWTVWT